MRDYEDRKDAHMQHQADIGDEMDEAAKRRCPDGGYCGRLGCDVGCFRVRACGPLSGVFPNDKWPAEVLAANEVKPEPEVIMRFLLLTYNDSVHGRSACILVSSRDAIEWSVLEGLVAPIAALGYGALTRGWNSLASTTVETESVQLRTLDLPDFEPVSGDADWYWQRGVNVHG